MAHESLIAKLIPSVTVPTRKHAISSARAGTIQEASHTHGGIRVLIALPCFYEVTGAGTNERRLAQAIASNPRVDRVYVIVSSSLREIIGAKRSMRNPKISLWILPRIPSPHPAIYVAQLVGYGFFFAFVSVLLKKLKAIDIVYVRESWLAFGFVSLRSLISPIAAKVPFNCAKETFGEHKNGFAGVYVRLAAQLERYAIMNADFLFTAPGSSQKLIQIRGDERGVTELRQPIPLDFFGAHSLGTYNKKEYVVGYVGDISPNHMVDVVVRAMRLVQNELPNVRLLLAGDADPGNLLKIIQLMNNLKLENSVMLRVDESNIPKLYESMDLVVVPNIRSLGRSGAVGLKFVEAVAANVPFVASRTVALQNLLAGSGIEDVVFVDSDDPREWASKIRALMMHHDLRQHVATVVSSHLKSYLESHRPEAVAATFITRYGLQPIGQGSVDPSCTTHSER